MMLWVLLVLDIQAVFWLAETTIESASIWKPSQLTRLLLNFDLLKAGQIDADLAKKFRRVQKENFSKMSKFSNFCNFLGSCNSGGIHLVAFYFKLHMFLCSKNYESAEEILHQIKNEFLDEGKGLLRTICGHDGHSGRGELIVRMWYRPWSPHKGSSSCLPKEARIEYEKQEKSVAGKSSYWLAQFSRKF